MKMTIGKKLGLGFGIVLLIFVISGSVTVSQLRGIKENLYNIVEVETPTSAAAYEMEINLIGTGFGVLGYLNDRDPVHLQRIKDDTEDFEEFKGKYLELAYADEKKLGLALGERYDDYMKLANKIIALEDNQDKKIAILFENFLRWMIFWMRRFRFLSNQMNLKPTQRCRLLWRWKSMSMELPRAWGNI